MRRPHIQEMVVNRDCGLCGEVSAGDSSEAIVISRGSRVIHNAADDFVGNHTCHVGSWAWRRVMGSQEHTRLGPA